jgi:hypothetical protein
MSRTPIAPTAGIECPGCVVQLIAEATKEGL